MTQASVRLQPYGIISGAVLTRARLPIDHIFGEILAAKELGLVFVPTGQVQRAKGPVDLRTTRKSSQQNHVSDQSASGESGTINALVAINSRVLGQSVSQVFGPESLGESSVPDALKMRAPPSSPPSAQKL